MNSLHLSLIVIVIVVLTGTVFILIESQTETSKIKSHVLDRTMSIEEVRSLANFTLKIPFDLPNGYEFIGAQASSIDARLMYWNQTITDGNFASPQQIAQGAIVLLYKLDNEKTNPAYHIVNRTAVIISLSDELTPNFKVRLVPILGNLALVREGCDSCGVQSAIFSNNSTITTSVPAPTLIMFFDDDVQYVVESSLPSSILEKIAQSMK